MLSIHLGSTNQDDTAWKDPDNFRPERHLDQDGNLIRNDAFLPFGLGILNLAQKWTSKNVDNLSQFILLF